jgi:predicted NBD/HSP70 family sugar kinase
VRRIDLKKVNVARSNTIRDINRQIVLNYVREKGPISRAEIARETNLQRSTISLIIKDLRRIGLIEEVYGESSGGRPPSLLTLPTSHPVAVGVDLGTVKTIVATCDLTGRVIEKEEFWTDPDARRTTSLIVESVNRLTRGHEKSIEGIGISIPALVDAAKGHVLYGPHFKWRDPEIIETIGKATGFTVAADNDANAAAFAELWFGEAAIREVRDFVLVFIENGIGTGIVFDGQIHRGKGGVAGEFGHMRIGTDAPIACANESRECWEAFASERAALARYARLLGNQKFADRINFVQLVELGFKGDANALAALKETAHYIGLGMGNLIQGLSPEAIVVAGNFASAWPLVGEEIMAAADRVVCQGMTATRIIPSTLGTDHPLMGAFSLVLADKFASVSI